VVVKKQPLSTHGSGSRRTTPILPTPSAMSALFAFSSLSLPSLQGPKPMAMVRHSAPVFMKCCCRGKCGQRGLTLPAGAASGP